MAKLYAGLAHEIRTPLTTLSNLISMLPDRLGDSDYRQLLVTLVPAEVARIAALAEKLRAMAPGASSRTSMDLGQLLHNLIALQHSRLRDRALELSLHIEPDLPMIFGDHDRLVQLFTNLVQNAIDASPTRAHIEVHARSLDSTIVVQVLDEGSGLSSEIEDRLFEPFLTTKTTGMGLGLSICREIAEAHNARLILENRDDRRGAKAEVVFPAPALASVSAAS
jgi:signal transduction histidine kinase